MIMCLRVWYCVRHQSNREQVLLRSSGIISVHCQVHGSVRCFQLQLSLV